MIIFGSKATLVATENLLDKCPNCGTERSVQLAVFQNYAHIFFIPLFPMGKTGATECAHCKQVLRKKEFPDQVRRSYTNLKSASKAPLWTFSGLGLLAIFIVFGGIMSKQKDEKNAAWILAPQEGDVYEIKLDYKQYTLYKVHEVVGDTVFVMPNEYETDKIKGLRAMKNKGDAGFVQEFFPLLKEDLKIMLESGELLDIDRKE